MSASGRSIFYKVARKEDDYTQLLCNLMQRPELEGKRFRTAVLEELLNDTKLTPYIQPDHISTQRVIPGTGRPDLVIDAAPTVCALIEVKLNPRRGCTDNQTLEEGGTMGRYYKYLHLVSAERKVSRSILVFLVPGDWELLEKMRGDMKKFKGKYPSVETKIVLWEDIFKLSERFSRNPLLREFRNLLYPEFSPVLFTDKEKKMAICGGSSPISTIIKAAYVVDMIAKKCKDNKYLFSSQKAEKDGEAYGMEFYRKRIGREHVKAPFFWFGIWSPYWEKHGKALCFGVRDDWKAEKKAFLGSFDGKTSRFSNPVDESDVWTLGWIPETDLIDPVNKVWERLEPILKEVCTAGKSRT